MPSSSLRIFISYRREDSAGHAGRLADHLAVTFGSENVFIDVDAIEPGLDFREAIEEWVGSCDVFIAVLGRDWTRAADSKGARRLHSERDYVRLEIEAALHRGVRVIPALVEDADMPSASELPSSLASLVYKNAISLRDTSFRADSKRLIEVLERLERQKAARDQAQGAPETPAPQPGPPTGAPVAHAVAPQPAPPTGPPIHREAALPPPPPPVPGAAVEATAPSPEPWRSTLRTEGWPRPRAYASQDFDAPPTVVVHLLPRVIVEDAGMKLLASNPEAGIFEAATGVSSLISLQGSWGEWVIVWAQPVGAGTRVTVESKFKVEIQAIGRTRHERNLATIFAALERRLRTN